MSENDEIVNYVTCQPIHFVRNIVDKLTARENTIFFVISNWCLMFKLGN